MLTKELRQRHHAMLSDPQAWPNWPILPMKHYGDEIRSGFAVTADYPLVVLKKFPSMQGVLLQLACEDGVPVPGSTEVRTADEQARSLYESMIEARFDDVDGMLDAGWVID